MSDLFDPYYTWLAIPPGEQPPDHYRLLGLPRYEANPDVISNAMDQRSAYLRTLQTGRHAADSQRLLNEVAAAAGCLLNLERKGAYDQQLRDAEVQRPVPVLAAPESALATKPALKPQYPASLLPRPGEVVASPALPVQETSSARPNMALIAAAIAVPLVLAVIVIAALALGGGDPDGGQAEVIPPDEPHHAPPTPVSTSVTPPANNAPPAASGDTGVSVPSAVTPAIPPSVPSAGSGSAIGPLPKFQPGRGVDLLPWAATDLRLIRGDAKYDGRVLSVASQSTAFTLPADFPDEYILEADVTRESGTNSLCFGFPVHGRPLTAVIDGFFSKQSGLASIDSREIYTEVNPQVKNGRVLTNGKQATVRIEVTAGAVRLAVDGQTLVAWNWDPAAKVRSAQGMHAGDLTRLHVFTWDAAYRITRLQLLPLPGAGVPLPRANPQTTPPSEAQPTESGSAAAAASAVDLLRADKNKPTIVRGYVSRKGAAIRTTDETAAFNLPVEFPEEYVLEIDVVRESGNNGICVGFTVFGQPLTAVIDGLQRQRHRTGLASINGRETFTENNPEVKFGPLLTNGQQATIRIEVSKVAVRLSVGQTRIVDWPYDPQAKLRSAKGMHGGDLDRLHVWTWESSFLITRLELQATPQ